MPYQIRFSSRKAKCHDCKDKIDDMDPRVDHERDDDAPEGEEQAGWRVRRFCLKCGLARMEHDLHELSARITEATNVWNLISKRKGVKKRSPAKAKGKKTIKCDTCGKPAVCIAAGEYGKLWVCQDGHPQVTSLDTAGV